MKSPGDRVRCQARESEKEISDLLFFFPLVPCWTPHGLHPTGSWRTNDLFPVSQSITRVERTEPGGQRQLVVCWREPGHRGPLQTTAVAVEADQTCSRGSKGLRSLRCVSMCQEGECEVGGDGPFLVGITTHRTPPHSSPDFPKQPLLFRKSW